MKKNKGFTLIELLAVIVLLGIIFTIGVMSIMKIINNAKQDTLATQENLFLEAGTNYFVDQMVNEGLILDQYETVEVNLTTLVTKGYIKSITDPTTDGSCEGTSTVEIGYAGGRKYIYAKDFVCGTYTSTEDSNNFLLDSYDLITGTQDYLTDNPGSKPANIGDKASILYTTVKAAGDINTIYNPNTTDECLSASKVVVEKLTTDTYAYYPGLVCDDYINVEAHNLISNYDFEEGTTDWIVANGSVSASSNNLSITGDGTLNNVNVYQTTETASTVGNTLYFRTVVRVTDIDCSNLRIKIDGATAGTITQMDSQSAPLPNQWYTLSGVLNTPADFTGNLKPFILHDYADAATANDKTMQVDGITPAGVLLLDVTALYGASKTKTEMDTIMENSGY